MDPEGDTAVDVTLLAIFEYLKVFGVGVAVTVYVPLNVASTSDITTVSPFDRL